MLEGVRAEIMQHKLRNNSMCRSCMYSAEFRVSSQGCVMRRVKGLGAASIFKPRFSGRRYQQEEDNAVVEVVNHVPPRVSRIEDDRNNKSLGKIWPHWPVVC